MGISEAELRKILGPAYDELVTKGKVKRSKFGNKKTVVDGRRFDSLLEAKRYKELAALVRAGELMDVLCHTPTIRFPGTNITYTLDFLVVAKDWTFWMEDVKGHQTKEWKMKWKMARALHPNLDMRFLLRKGDGWDVRIDV